MSKVNIHEDTRVAEPKNIGEGTSVWQFSILKKGCSIGEAAVKVLGQ